MTLDDLVDLISLNRWDNVMQGFNLNNRLTDNEIALIRTRISQELASIKRKFYMTADSNFSSLSQAYSNFSRAAYDGLSELCFNPEETLNFLPKRTKTHNEYLLEKKVSKMNKIKNAVTFVLAAAGAAIAIKISGKDSVITPMNYLLTGASAVTGGALGYFASKLLFKIPFYKLNDQLNKARINADHAFFQAIDKYIADNKAQ